jgi:hypothetical protein
MKRVAYTIVEHGGKRYAVSTINRECSAMLSGGRVYAETVAFEIDAEDRLVKMVGQDEAGCDSRRAHDAMVERIRRTGSGYPADDEGGGQ